MPPIKDSPLKPRQIDILLMLFRFRFLTRSQIQVLLNHKNHRKVTQWLNELSSEQYVIKSDRQSVIAPAIYSLSPLSRQYLKDKKLVKQLALLDRVWRETSYSAGFRDKCRLIADLYLSLLAQPESKLRFLSKTELYGIEYLPEPAPDAYFVIGEKSQANRFFVEVPTYHKTKNLIDIIDRYADYYYYGEWQKHTNKDFPHVIIICSNKTVIKAASRYIRDEYADEPDLRFHIMDADQALSELLSKKA